MLPKPDVLWREAVVTLRGLRKERTFALLSVTLLALGIGFTSAVFTLLWQALYARLPVHDPQQIYSFTSNVTHNGRSDSDAMAETFSVPSYRNLATHWKTAEGVVARHGEMVNLETPVGSRHLLAEFVSGNYFSVLGVRAALGSTLGSRNDVVSDDRFAVVLSYDFWQEAYGGGIAAWNTTLRVNGVPFRVTGVAAPGFRGLIGGQAPKIYLPVSSYADVNPGWRGDDDWALRWLNLFVRLPGGMTAALAEAQLQPVYRAAVREELASEGPQSPEYLNELTHEYMRLTPAVQGNHAFLDQWTEPLRILQWMTLAVLSLAAINVAGLMVVRAVKKRQEVLIRYAVGATRAAVMRLPFLQTLTLALAGGLLGLWVSRWGAQLLVHMARLDRGGAFVFRPHGWSLILHWAAVWGTGLLVAILPVWQAARTDLAGGLSSGALTHSANRSQALIRRSLAAVQIALSLVLTIAAGLFAQALHRLVAVPVGFDSQHLTVFSVDPKLAGSTLAGTEILFANLAEGLKRRPEVQSVTYGTGGPFPQGSDAAVVIPGTIPADIARHQTAMRSIIGPEYFQTLGIRVTAGREFEEHDRLHAPDVVMVNEVLARKLFGATNPLDRTVTIFNGVVPKWTATVIGVVADYHQSWKRSGTSLVYTPALQAKQATDMTYYVRTRTEALSEPTIREIVKADVPSIAPYDIATMRNRMAEFASTERALAILLGTFAILALAIAAIGIYGVVAYGSSLRTVEFGVRVSVGARSSDITKLVMREAVLILGSGILLAVPATYFAVTLMRHQIGTISVPEPTIYLGAVFVLTTCTLIAALIPARRATRMSVSGALRYN